MTSIGISTLFAAACLAATCAEGQELYTTTFTSGTNFVPTYQAGSFSATFAGPDLTFFAQPLTADDPCIRNIGPGSLSLTFSQPVTTISFDVGGLDGFWGDGVRFDTTSTLGPTLNRAYYFTHIFAAFSSTTLICPTTNDGSAGARITFANLGGAAGVTSFGWSDVGTAGTSDWVLYDNFSFTVVPEPAALSLAVLGAGILRILRPAPNSRRGLRAESATPITRPISSRPAFRST